MQTLIPILLLLALGGCSLSPTPDAAALVDSQTALDRFQTEERLNRFFDEASVVVVFPSAWRAGMGFGGGYALGTIYRDNRAVGVARMWQVSVGANVGGQRYRQILFFKTDAAFEAMGRASNEFAGQAHAALITAGGATNPGYNPDVAVFSQLRGGLLLEASVGLHRYEFSIGE
ncbi:hypothetical protein [Ferrimonas balearica]|uniref:hypothetical protein n=1 Tax=Ferrimonas balearica TaxID=44012 RepID=UPI001C990226|nr:hypothetical protein [Ferrimonas balearica]MBY5921199.1 hypothetical protein [Ferrimonas balearica]MBY5996116.1 hypothetical protein [Ferrimonas balearica]